VWLALYLEEVVLTVNIFAMFIIKYLGFLTNILS
jgi:hypothetical protein